MSGARFGCAGSVSEAASFKPHFGKCSRACTGEGWVADIDDRASAYGGHTMADGRPAALATPYGATLRESIALLLQNVLVLATREPKIWLSSCRRRKDAFSL
jgi:hypothetical protein